MPNLNKVFLMGNLTRDPELSYLPSNQTPVCEIGIAINRTWNDKDGTKKEETTFVDCTSFGKLAENIAKFFTKGRPIFIEGRLKLDQWKAQDGTSRSKMRVVIESFQFVGGDKAGQAPQATQQPTRPTTRPTPAPSYDESQESAGPPITSEDIPFAPNYI